jgi:orotidine-5'-phosphate decarboxylase
MLKVGLELFNSAGPGALEAIGDLGDVFYDSKFYDIPNTVAGAAAAVGRLGVRMFNVHALGGRAMMRAAKEGAAKGAAQAGFPPPLVIAVTIVTSIGDEALREELGIAETAAEAVPRLALLAKESGLDGVVASVHEVPEIKRVCGKNFLTVTPGIRPSWAEAGDQTRVATPRAALSAGADYLVIGRPIIRAEDPGQALARILSDIGE